MPRQKSPVPENAFMELLKIDIRSSISVYQQIENLVLFAVASGQLTGGDQLPSVDALAKRLDVNMNTIAKAYRDLQVMGIVDARRGMGVFISKGSEARCRKLCHEQVARRLFEAACEARMASIAPSTVDKIVKAAMNGDAAPYGGAPSAVLSLIK